MKRSFLFIYLIIIYFISCKEEKSKPDVSHINVNFSVVRFEKELFALDTNNIETGLKNLKSKYPEFFDLYFSRILPFSQDSLRFSDNVKNFISFPSIIKLNDTTNRVLKNISKPLNELERCFLYVKYYFPEYKIPNVYTFISEFSLQKFIFEDGSGNAIGIGLDMFLGNTYPYKQIDPTNPYFSNYLTRTYNIDHIAPKAIDLIIDELVPTPSNNRMIDLMVANGKKLYLKNLFCTELSDTVIYEYTQEQLDWVKDNELEIWSFFTDKNLMYETGPDKINKYLRPAPTSIGMPAASPGCTANFIGLKIVEAFMKNNKIPLNKMLEIRDGQQFFERSKYKPKRK